LALAVYRSDIGKLLGAGWAAFVGADSGPGRYRGPFWPHPPKIKPVNTAATVLRM